MNTRISIVCLIACLLALIASTVLVFYLAQIGVVYVPVINKASRPLVLVYDVKPYGSSMASTAIALHLKDYMKYDVPIANYEFFVQLYSSYTQLLRDYENTSKLVRIEMENTNLCNVFSKNLKLIIERIKNEENGYTKYRMTLEFVNGVAICGRGFDKPLKFLGVAKRLGGLRIIKFRVLNVSRYVLVDPSTLEAYGDDGEPLGTWIFDIGSAIGKPTLLLYSVNDFIKVVNVKAKSIVHGLAIMLTLTKPYRYSDMYVYSLSLQPFEIIEYRYRIPKYGTALNVTKLLSNCSFCKDMVRSYATSNDETMIVLKPKINYLTLAKVPRDVKFIDRLTSYCRYGTVNGMKIRVCSYQYGVLWSNRSYVASINACVKEIAYSSNGILVMVKIDASKGGFLAWALPSVVVRAFAITPLSLVNAQFIDLELEK